METDFDGMEKGEEKNSKNQGQRVGRAEIERAKDLMKRYVALTARDAIHCTIAINHNLEGIISTEKDLDIVTEIACFEP